MSWNGHIPTRSYKPKGLRNKRNKKSPKAIIARMNRQAKRSKSRERGFGVGGGGGGPRRDWSSFDV